MGASSLLQVQELVMPAGLAVVMIVPRIDRQLGFLLVGLALLMVPGWVTAVRADEPVVSAVDRLLAEDPRLSELVRRDPTLLERIEADPTLAGRLATRPPMGERLTRTLTHPLALFGFGAQFLFMMRFLVQWIASERKKRSYVPVAFWYFSIGGGVLLLIYSIQRRDPVFIMGQSLGLLIYTRNLFLIRGRAQVYRDRLANRVDRRPTDSPAQPTESASAV